MKKHDIVYILKPLTTAEELRYSLRSIEKNFEHGNVYFIGGKPEGIEPDIYIEHEQIGINKWERVRSSLILACENKDISKEFWLFNDDFYILKPWKSDTPLHRGFIHDHVLSVEAKHGARSVYANKLRDCEQLLKGVGLTTFDYALHAPMLIDKQKMLEALTLFPDCPMFRSLYGNYAMIGGTYSPDNKIAKDGTYNDKAPFLSSSDKTFEIVEEYLESMFPEPSKWEVIEHE